MPCWPRPSMAFINALLRSARSLRSLGSAESSTLRSRLHDEMNGPQNSHLTCARVDVRFFCWSANVMLETCLSTVWGSKSFRGFCVMFSSNSTCRQFCLCNTEAAVIAQEPYIMGQNNFAKPSAQVAAPQCIFHHHYKKSFEKIICHLKVRIRPRSPCPVEEDTCSSPSSCEAKNLTSCQTTASGRRLCALPSSLLSPARNSLA